MCSDKAPETLEALNQKLLAARRGDETIKGGRRSLLALEKLLHSPQKVALGSISDAARIAGVHPSTLTRLAHALGYEGFPAFQRVFRKVLVDSPDYYSRHADSLMSDARKLAHTSFVERFVEAEIANLRQWAQGFPRQELEAVAERLIRARQIWVQAGRQSRSLADLMVYGLGLLRHKVSDLNASDRGIAWGLGQVRKGDLLVVIGFAPYTRSTLAAATLAGELGAQVLALTDQPQGPLAAHAHHTVAVPADSLFFSNSQVVAVTAIQLMLSQVAAQMGPQAMERLKAYEDRVNQLTQWL